jgi:hypothetical protein
LVKGYWNFCRKNIGLIIGLIRNGQIQHETPKPSEKVHHCTSHKHHVAIGFQRGSMGMVIQKTERGGTPCKSSKGPFQTDGMTMEHITHAEGSSISSFGHIKNLLLWIFEI